MNITTINDERTITYDYYNKQPMEMVESKLKLIIAESTNL